jgi:hypothetical protein
MEILYAAAAMFVSVFAKSFQQRNVAFSHFIPVIPTSWVMAACEIYVVSVIVVRGFDPAFVFSVGTAAGCGAMGAMYIHHRVFGDKK